MEDADDAECVTCVADTHVDRKGQSWCGKPLVGFHFTDADHAAHAGRNGAWQVVCPDCLKELVKALSNGHADAD